VARVLAALDSPAMRDALAAETVSSPTDPLGSVPRPRLDCRAGRRLCRGEITRPEWQAALASWPSACPRWGRGIVRHALRLPANVAEAWPGLEPGATAP